MKNFLLTFLMAVMLMPGLACAMPQCLHKEYTGQAIFEKPCHGHEDRGQGEQNHGFMFFKDCAKSDLWNFTSDAVVKKPDTAAREFAIPATVLLIGPY